MTKEICEQWRKDMRNHTGIVIGVLIVLLGVKPYILP